MTMPTHSSERLAGSGPAISNSQRWIGRILSGLASLFLLFDGIMKLAKPPIVVQSTLQLGYAESTILGIGLTLLVCTLLYIVPRSSVLGAVLLTGYLGGAVASNIRAGKPVFNAVFPMIMAALLWGGLWLRDLRVRNVLRGPRPGAPT
jgi:hypothetical protein